MARSTRSYCRSFAAQPASPTHAASIIRQLQVKEGRLARNAARYRAVARGSMLGPDRCIGKWRQDAARPTRDAPSQACNDLPDRGIFLPHKYSERGN
ncbi:unnamed protein product, partial [Ectocarpus sp. 12 AP-2014]